MSTVLTVKLDDKNSILLRKFVLAVLMGQMLDGYILGTKQQPSEYISSITKFGTTTLILNPTFEAWVTMDQALLG